MWSGDQHRAQSVLIACGQKADGRCSGQGDLRLGAVLGTEVHGGRYIDHHPCLEVAVRDLVAHVQFVRSSGDVPIDAAHVVTRLVRTRLAWLTAVPGCDSLVLAVQLAVETTVDRELQ